MYDLSFPEIFHVVYNVNMSRDAGAQQERRERQPSNEQEYQQHEADAE
jgi:hypothetical protein